MILFSVNLRRRRIARAGRFGERKSNAAIKSGRAAAAEQNKRILFRLN